MLLTVPHWQLHGVVGQLRTATLQGIVDLQFPNSGLTNLTFGETPLAGLSLLRVQRTDIAAALDSPPDCYIRADDLVGIYENADGSPFRFQIYWRVLNVLRVVGAAGIELTISVQTRLLDSDPTARVISDLPHGNVRWWNASYDQWNDAPLGLSVQLEPGYLVYELPAGRGSYVEMVHPLDFSQGEIQRTDHGASVDYPLFAQRLEKGVLLRSRMRGYFVPPGTPDSLLSDLYLEFAAAELPLTT